MEATRRGLESQIADCVRTLSYGMPRGGGLGVVSQETGLRGQSLQQVRPARAAAARARSVCKAEASSQPVRIRLHPPSLSTTTTARTPDGTQAS